MPAPVEVVVLAGGTGGAKLARGMREVVAPERLAVIANPGDDIEIYGAHVSPDPDLISFWLADLIDARGWGLEGDTFNVMDGLRALGVEVWFNLGDRDLAWCVERARLLAAGATPTAALARLNAAIGVRTAVLPASDDPVRTWVRTTSGWRSFQEFMIRMGAAGMIEGLEFRGAEQAAPSTAALEAIAQARAIVIGPSNPLASIAPILAVPGIREALATARAPVVAVSPIVGGTVLKGPTAAFMAFAALECSAAGVADFYGELLDGLVADEPVAAERVPAVAAEPAHHEPLPALATLRIDTRMDDAAARARVAEQVLAFADGLAR
ncbi:MAG TPA: 2-phospho-L-lactate transferase [Solirubrobacteraceae bacterium]|jgi:LPPG:FO 2-phospho-L-lactate transferase|nr:2-phospho-L-lactate transferase [Solirubrobacteraceae bacterium]